MSSDDASPSLRVIPTTPRHLPACASASSPATAWSCRSNRPSRALRADPSKRHPPDRFRLSSNRACDGTDKGSLDRAPLLRFSSPSALTGRDARCPGQGPTDLSVGPGQPPDDPASTFPRTTHPRLGRDPSLWRSSLRFSAGQNRCDGARLVADAGGRSVPVESVVCVHAFRLAPWARPRLDDLLLASRSSSIVRAGGTVYPSICHAHERPDHVERRRRDSAARAGSFADAFLGAAFQTRF
jgi:hypothetical protein